MSATSFDEPYRDPERLRKMYLDRGMTTREIANRFNCSNGTISRWLNRHNIPTRENWTAGVKAAKRANRRERVTVRTLESGYEYWASKEQRPGESSRTSEIVYVHRLLAVAEYGIDAVADSEIHHLNGVPWDNRPENITLLDESAHGRLHSIEYHSEEGGAS